MRLELEKPNETLAKATSAPRINAPAYLFIFITTSLFIYDSKKRLGRIGNEPGIPVSPLSSAASTGNILLM